MSDPRLPSDERCVVRTLLDVQARRYGSRVFVVFETGETWSFAEFHHLVRGTAAALSKLGVRPDERIVVWMQNSADMLRVWFAINYLGAVYVPINTAYRGPLLSHVLNDADASLLIADGTLVERLVDTTCPIKRVVAFGHVTKHPSYVEILPQTSLDPATSPPPLISQRPWDLAALLYTSGTTGPSKGVMITHAQHFFMAQQGMYFCTERDRFLVNLPLFHMGGTMYVVGALERGASIVLLNRFRTQTFWDVVKMTEATSCLLLGTLVNFLMQQPPSPADRDHGLSTVAIIPFLENALSFGARFGVTTYTFFDMTESSAPIASGPNPSVRGSCGTLQPGYAVRISDEHDCEVPQGSVGELLIRADAPWALSEGYFRNPQATAKAWRNGWFHTGDAFRLDRSGHYYFVDRIKDVIRRRGESISSFEVENVLMACANVAEVAVVPVPSALGEDEVMAVIALKPGVTVDLAAFLDVAAKHLPRFMVPRFVRVLDVLPKTESNKIKKTDLKREGVTSDTWDREAPENIRKKSTLETAGRK